MIKTLVSKKVMWGVFVFCLAILLTSGVSAGSSSDKKTDPKCDNAHVVSETGYECHHWADDPDGATCSKVECIKNVLNTATCDKHEDRTGTPNCDVDDDTGAAVIQSILTAKCPGGKVAWSIWHAINYGCEDDCDTNNYRHACETTSCSGKVVRGPYNRGFKYKVGCD